MFTSIKNSIISTRGFFPPTKSAVFTKDYVEVNSQILSVDGTFDVERSISMLSALNELGCTNVTLTPKFKNAQPKKSFDTILSSFTLLKTIASNTANLKNLNLNIAAEYQLDENFVKHLEKDNLLLIQGDILLLKTPNRGKMSFYKEIISEIKHRGYFPLLTFPETHHFFHQDLSRFYEFKSWGALFQTSLLSFTSFYKGNVKVVAHWMLMNKLIDCVSSGLNPDYLDIQLENLQDPFKLNDELLETIIQKKSITY